jgi:hypothetical protein
VAYSTQWREKLKKIKLEEEIDFDGYPLKEILFFLSKESQLNIIGDSSTEGMILDMSFRKGTNLFQVLEGINRAKGLKVKNIENLLILSKRISNIIDERNFIGQVIDSQYGIGIEGAKISFINGDALPAYTQKGGFFIAEDIDPGAYLINVEKHGYYSETDVIEVKPNGEKLVIELNRNGLPEKTKEEALRSKINSIKQVRITAQVIDVTDNLFEDLGFSWIYGANDSAYNKGYNANILGAGTIEGIGTVYPMGMGIVKTFNNKEDIFNLAINLLQTTQDLVIKASPSLVVLDGEIGEFKTTEEIVAGQRKIVNSNDEIEYVPIFKEAGTILKVRPIVYNDETIQLNLNLEVSDFKLKKSVQSGVYIENGGTYNEEGGSKTSRSINTVIRVKNGETIFIGGLKKTSVKNEISKVPVLGDIPVVKTFFRNEVVRNEKTELFVKIKAEIEGSYNPQIESNKYETRERTRIYPRIEF